MRKLQKLDGAFGMNPFQLVDVAFKVFNKRERQQKKEDAKGNATFLAVALDSQKASNLKRGKPPLGKGNTLTVRRKDVRKRLPQAKT